MDREKILAYSERTENLGEPEVFLGTGEVKEPGCGDQLNMYINTKREIITEFHYTVTDSACPPLKACAARVAEAALGKPVMEAYLIRAEVCLSFLADWKRKAFTVPRWQRLG